MKNTLPVRLFLAGLFWGGACGAGDTAPRYLITVLNLNWFRNLEDRKSAARSVTEFVRRARRYGVEPELYFTGLSLEGYRRYAPDLVNRLRRGSYAWHHHGANRNPKPTPLDRIRGLDWEAAVEAIAKYESSALDPKTGRLDPTRPGGLKAMCEFFGRPPLSTGRFFKAPILYVCRSYGVRMGCGLHDTLRLPSAWFWYMGALNRPDDVFIHPTWDFDPWVQELWERDHGPIQPAARRRTPREPVDLFARINARLRKLDPNLPAFIVFTFHDHDFFGCDWRSRQRYSRGFQEFYMDKAEETMRRLVRVMGLRPVSLEQVLAAASSRRRTPRTRDVPALARELCKAVEQNRGLPLYVQTANDAFSLVETWQALVGTLNRRQLRFPSCLGPTSDAPPAGSAPGDLDAAAVTRAAASAPIRGAIPASIRVGRTTVNAAQFLHLAAQVIQGEQRLRLVPLRLAPTLPPGARCPDLLTRLQLWTFKPAWFSDRRQTQRTTSLEVNVLSQQAARSRQSAFIERLHRGAGPGRTRGAPGDASPAAGILPGDRPPLGRPPLIGAQPGRQPPLAGGREDGEIFRPRERGAVGPFALRRPGGERGFGDRMDRPGSKPPFPGRMLPGCKPYPVRLPSEGAGGGALAVLVEAPDKPDLARYPEGAPVLVLVMGGFSPVAYGRSRMPQLVRHGVVLITFNYPGGGEGETRSDGEYDYRGIRSLQAVRDVVRFALGELRDQRGRKLHEVVGLKILYSDVGVLGSSSGGIVFFGTFGLYPKALRNLAFYVGWENPTTSQTLLVDLGGHDIRSGKPWPNPAFLAYGPESCRVDYSRLKWDPDKEFDVRDYRHMDRGAKVIGRDRGALYLDNNGNGRCDVPVPYGGRSDFDLNRNGKPDKDEDWAFWAFPEIHDGRVRYYYSLEVIRAATEHRVFGPGGPPDKIATLAECRKYWRIRNSLRGIRLIPRYAPNLRVLLVSGRDDHAQGCPVFPGIQQAYDAFGRARVWRRLNPDIEYVRLVLGPRTPRDMPDNDANCTIRPGTMRRYAHPVDRPFIRNGALIAAVLEMSDRVYKRCWDRNLRRVLWQAAGDKQTMPGLPFQRAPLRPVLRPGAGKWKNPFRNR